MPRTLFKGQVQTAEGNRRATAGGMATISMKECDYEGTKGYYVNDTALNEVKKLRQSYNEHCAEEVE